MMHTNDVFAKNSKMQNILFNRIHVHMGSDHWVAILVSIYLRDVVDLVKTVNVVSLVEDSS